MAIELFEHNQRAYENVVAMLGAVGKACVIHPTGTGKSFIGFKLCEDNPDKKVLWLAPSEYIFDTQIENLKKTTGGYAPENISFYTYAKLMLMSDDELKAIKADICVYDEYHRAGAVCWQGGIERLRAIYPDVSVLGLSATNIRYLDNQRNMADELFNGQIASNMTLGEAIVRNILNPPKYVLSLFSYSKDLEKYERRVQRTRNKVIRSKAEKYLDALKRALENADGLDRIFDKHMTDRHGKYIVFTPNFEAMQEYITHCDEWFGRVDKKYHVYSVYSDDPTASKSFNDFKNDSSDHLRLLFCIDALNEGIHVEDVSGVILMRPTVSPIIYKQQIGRALSASKSKEPIIFDIVNNIENLYSIDSIKEEMEIAINYFREYDGGAYIINETFDVIDEVKNYIEIFNELEETLTVSWEVMYSEAKKYYQQNGDLIVPQTYITESGLQLGWWVGAQRCNRRKGDKSLTPEKIAKLDAIGMCWLTQDERLWNEAYEISKRYYEQNHTLDGIKAYSARASSWIIGQRRKYRDGTLSAEQIKMLEDIGMIWDIDEYQEDVWLQFYKAAEAYYQENKNLDIPANYLTADGLSLGGWYRRMRNEYRESTISAEHLEKLELIGFEAESVITRRWKANYDAAVTYYEEHHDLEVPLSYADENGVKLGAWIYGQRDRFSRGLVPEEQKELLDSIGMSWDRYDAKWEKGFQYAMRYISEYGDINNVPEDFRYDNFKLLVWIRAQRTRYRQGKLSPERVSRLEEIGLAWEKNKAFWDSGYKRACEYRDKHNNLNIVITYICEDGFKLGGWLSNQKTRYKSGKLTDEQIAKLEKIGIVWKPYDGKWDNGLSHATEYRNSHNDLNVPNNYVCADGYKLGNWIVSTKIAFKKGKLSEEKKQQLDDLGMIWSPKDEKWNEGYIHAEAYYNDHGTGDIPHTYVSPDGFKLGEWKRAQIRMIQRGKMTFDRLDKLSRVGIRAAV